MRIATAILFVLLSGGLRGQHYDWSMWRYDHQRSASTPEQLPENLYLQWQIHIGARTPVWDDPLNWDLMQFDRLLEPIVADGRLFIGFNDQDKVVAYDLQTGKELWQYYVDGPVRMPLAACNGHIYFTSDDGWCYSLEASTGSLAWKKQLAPANNKLLGNKRLISMWPARGGIVIKDNIIYTAASIFPLMGTFIYALDANNGEIIWKNDGTSSNYILQPHNSPAFADVAPQGCFTISGNKLLVAGGRSVPAGFDLKTGEKLYYELAKSGKTGGSFTCANDRVFFNHSRKRMTAMFDSETGAKLKQNVGEYPVIDGNTIYFSGDSIIAMDLSDDNKLEVRWTAAIAANCEMIKAGNCLYAADNQGSIRAVKLANDGPKVVWTVATGKKIERLVASNGKLIAVSEDGTILVYGGSQADKVFVYEKAKPSGLQKSTLASQILRSTGIDKGYATVFGADNRELLEGLAAETDLNFVVFDNNASKIAENRAYFDKLSIHADRMAFLKNDATQKSLPKYFSSLALVNDVRYFNNFNPATISQIYETIRPYGGKIWVNARHKDIKKLQRAVAALDLHGAELEFDKNYAIITKVGALEGSADWTHNYGDIANTVKSDDGAVKAPLGILWFGGNSNLDVLPRHGHGPSEQVVDGYLVIQGINCLSARDVYTGRVIWKKEFEYLKDDNWEIYYDKSYDEENPLDTKYNQIHLPGVNARGTNYIVTKEYVYVIEKNKCHLLDLKTGEEIKSFVSEDKNMQRFAYIGVYENYLILGNDFAEYPEVPKEEGEKTKPEFETFNVTASRELMVLDRFSGKKLWSIPANHGFLHNSIIAGNGILFCLDKLPQMLETRLRRRGESLPSGSRLLYLDIKTGKMIHEETKNIFGTWLGYSGEYNLLLQATRPSRDMLSGEAGRRMIVYNIDTKQAIWDREMSYDNPPIISHDKIYTAGEAFSLLTGEPYLEKDPITWEDMKWHFKREYGCNYIIASEHLLTFRSASAAFVNLQGFEGTANLGGFKSGCSPNLIAANGVLNSPDYTRTCQCAYQNQTSLAFVHMPWMNYWTNSNYVWNGKKIKRLGINLNAPGDRLSTMNTLWLDYPNVGGTDSGIPVNIYCVDSCAYRKEPISINSEDTPWVSASAIGGIRSLEITLSKNRKEKETSYTVNLYFAEPENKAAGDRIFNVNIQGKPVLEKFDIIREAGASDKEIVKSFKGIRAGDKLKIELQPVKGIAVLSGLELIMEN